MGQAAASSAWGSPVVIPQLQVREQHAQHATDVATSATAGAARPVMAGILAACGRQLLRHGDTRGAATPPAMAENTLRLCCLGLMGVRGPTPSSTRGLITINIAIVLSCKSFLVLPRWVEALWLWGGGWRSMDAAGAMLTGSFSVIGTQTRRGCLAAFVAPAIFIILAADCEPHLRGDAQGNGAAGSWTRAISILGALHCAAGSTTRASFHQLLNSAARASTTFS